MGTYILYLARYFSTSSVHLYIESDAMANKITLIQACAVQNNNLCNLDDVLFYGKKIFFLHATRTGLSISRTLLTML